MQKFVSWDFPGHAKSQVTKLLFRMHFLRLVRPPNPREFEQEPHAPHSAHSKGGRRSWKLIKGWNSRTKKIASNLIHFLILFLCLFSLRIFWTFTLNRNMKNHSWNNHLSVWWLSKGLLYFHLPRCTKDCWNKPSHSQTQMVTNSSQRGFSSPLPQ